MERKIIFTLDSGQPLHGAWKNFLQSPPRGYVYVDWNNQPVQFAPGQRVDSTPPLKRRLFHLKNKIPPLFYYYKYFEEKALSRRLDKYDSHRIYCINGRLYWDEKPWVVDFESPAVFFGWNFTAMRRYKERVKNVLQRENCRALLASCETWKKSCIELFGEGLRHKVHIVPYAIRPPKETTRIKHGGFNILFTGSSNITDNFYFRGGREVVHAFLSLSKRYPDMKLIIRCAVPEREKRLLKGANVEIHEDILNKEQFSNLFRRSDIYLFPAHIGYALSTIEAMSYGLPVVTTNLLENGDTIEDGVNGFTIEHPPINYAGPLLPDYYSYNAHYALPLDEGFTRRIAESVEQLYYHKALRKRMARNNVAKVREKYSIESKNEILRKIFSA